MTEPLARSFTKQIIIVINGARGSGKNTVANVLGAYWGFTSVAFADKLKAVAMDLLPFEADQLYGASERRDEPLLDYPFSGHCTRCHRLGFLDTVAGASAEDYDRKAWYCSWCDRYYPRFLTARLVCESLGEEWGRTLNENIWVKATMKEILSSPGDQFVLTDVRYHREVTAIRDAGGYLIRLKRRWNEPRNGHRSDTEMLEMPDSIFDLVLPDAKSVDDHIPALRSFVLPLRQAAGLRGAT